MDLLFHRTCHTQANCLALKLLPVLTRVANLTYTTYVDWKCESTKICSKASGNWTTDKSISFVTKPSEYFYLGIVAEDGVINSDHPHDFILQQLVKLDCAVLQIQMIILITNAKGVKMKTSACGSSRTHLGVPSDDI